MQERAESICDRDDMAKAIQSDEPYQDLDLPPTDPSRQVNRDEVSR